MILILLHRNLDDLLDFLDHFFHLNDNFFYWDLHNLFYLFDHYLLDRNFFNHLFLNNSVLINHSLNLLNFDNLDYFLNGHLLNDMYRSVNYLLDLNYFLNLKRFIYMNNLYHGSIHNLDDLFELNDLIGLIYLDDLDDFDWHLFNDFSYHLLFHILNLCVLILATFLKLFGGRWDFTVYVLDHLYRHFFYRFYNLDLCGLYGHLDDSVVHLRFTTVREDFQVSSKVLSVTSCEVRWRMVLRVAIVAIVDNSWAFPRRRICSMAIVSILTLKRASHILSLITLVHTIVIILIFLTSLAVLETHLIFNEYLL